MALEYFWKFCNNHFLYEFLMIFKYYDTIFKIIIFTVRQGLSDYDNHQNFKKKLIIIVINEMRIRVENRHDFYFKSKNVCISENAKFFFIILMIHCLISIFFDIHRMILSRFIFESWVIIMLANVLLTVFFPQIENNNRLKDSSTSQ